MKIQSISNPCNLFRKGVGSGLYFGTKFNPAEHSKKVRLRDLFRRAAEKKI